MGHEKYFQLVTFPCLFVPFAAVTEQERKEEKSVFRRLENGGGRKENYHQLFPPKVMIVTGFRSHSFLENALSVLGRIWSQCMVRCLKT